MEQLNNSLGMKSVHRNRRELPGYRNTRTPFNLNSARKKKGGGIEENFVRWKGVAQKLKTNN